jgi:hypothetical protein
LAEPADETIFRGGRNHSETDDLLMGNENYRARGIARK